MKRILYLLISLMLVVSLAGCGSKKEDTITFSGTLLADVPPFGAGIMLDQTFELDGQKHDTLYFSTDVEKYLDRKYFKWDEDFGSILDDENKIQIKIEVKKDELSYVDSFWVENCKVLEVDGSTDLRDQTNNLYTIEYYKSLFYSYCYKDNDGFVPKDVKDTYYYKNLDTEIGDAYKKAVDQILDSGLFIVMAEGNYYISETDDNMDESEQIQTPETSKENDANTNSNQNESYYDPGKLKVGQGIGEFKVSELEYTKGKSILLKLSGKVSTTGTIIGYYNEMYDENEFIFKPDTSLLDKSIKYTFDSKWEGEIKNIGGIIQNSEILDQKTREYLLNGNEVKASVVIGSYTYAAQDESEGGEGVELSACKVTMN